MSERYYDTVSSTPRQCAFPKVSILVKPYTKIRDKCSPFDIHPYQSTKANQHSPAFDEHLRSTQQALHLEQELFSGFCGTAITSLFIDFITFQAPFSCHSARIVPQHHMGRFQKHIRFRRRLPIGTVSRWSSTQIRYRPIPFRISPSTPSEIR